MSCIHYGKNKIFRTTTSYWKDKIARYKLKQQTMEIHNLLDVKSRTECRLTVFTIDKDILQKPQSDPVVWNNFCQFPDLYKRIRIDAIQIKKNQPELFWKSPEQIHRKYPKRTPLRRMEWQRKIIKLQKSINLFLYFVTFASKILKQRLFNHMKWQLCI